MDDLSNLVHFAIVVDGEVAETVAFHPTAERVIAALSSNPVIVPISTKQLEQLRSGTIDSPWTYDGKNFVAPTQS
jgi:hypothetical protein